MIHTFAAFELSFGRANVLGELRALHEFFVLDYVEENGSATTVLRQNEGSAGLLYLAQELRGMSPELRKRLNVTRQLGGTCHKCLLR